MKKIFAMILVVFMIFAVGCSDDSSSSDKLTPYADLPNFQKDFKVVFEHVDSSKVSEEKINEIIRLVGGDKNNQTAIMHAQDVISKANSYKKSLTKD